MPFCHFSGHNLWLLKPTKLNRGRGIHVYNNLSMLKTLIYKYCEGFQKPNQSNPHKQISTKVTEAICSEGISTGVTATETLANN